MILGVPKETFPGERRVAMVPAALVPLTKKGMEVLIETKAGQEAGFPDSVYEAKGCRIVSRAEVFSQADAILQVRTLGANTEAGRADLDLFRPDQLVIGMADPLIQAAAAKELAGRKVTLFAMELIPRITRAQSMDILSSQATVAGYKAVLLAAETLPKMFPMLTTAAGTVAPAKVFVIGAGVAGLQAIATAKRLGAVVEAYDVRAVVKEQVQSVGAKFVELAIDAGQSEDKGGYAKAMDEEFYRRQREEMAKVCAANDVVITTAAIPGRKSPLLVTRAAVEAMAPGSVIVDLAAVGGGNCELTRADEVVVHDGVTILGPSNLPSTVPFHASQMYAKNVANLLVHLTDKEGKLILDMEDQITRETLVARGGEITNAKIRDALGLGSPPTAPGAAPAPPAAPAGQPSPRAEQKA
ncbi:MAG TPA: Re/Si-specific NAD(P)(+) transhydrogenase subunit alpha [Actinomycetota bacterium]